MTYPSIVARIELTLTTESVRDQKTSRHRALLSSITHNDDVRQVRTQSLYLTDGCLERSCDRVSNCDDFLGSNIGEK